VLLSPAIVATLRADRRAPVVSRSPGGARAWCPRCAGPVACAWGPPTHPARVGGVRTLWSRPAEARRCRTVYGSSVHRPARLPSPSTARRPGLVPVRRPRAGLPPWPLFAAPRSSWPCCVPRWRSPPRRPMPRAGSRRSRGGCMSCAVSTHLPIRGWPVTAASTSPAGSTCRFEPPVPVSSASPGRSRGSSWWRCATRTGWRRRISRSARPSGAVSRSGRARCSGGWCSPAVTAHPRPACTGVCVEATPTSTRSDCSVRRACGCCRSATRRPGGPRRSPAVLRPARCW